MLKRRMIALFFTFLSFTARAENLCQYLPGSWFGSYTFLHYPDCKENRGCNHLMDVNITRPSIYSIEFQADLTLQMGKQVQVKFNCQNSTITFPNYTTAITSFSCANGACFIKYQDDNVAATIIHVVTNDANN